MVEWTIAHAGAGAWPGLVGVVGSVVGVAGAVPRRGGPVVLLRLSRLPDPFTIVIHDLRAAPLGAVPDGSRLSASVLKENWVCEEWHRRVSYYNGMSFH